MEMDYLLIGVDGGATKVSAWEVDYEKSNNTFSLGNAHASISYRDIDGYISNFTPVEINTQLAERNNIIQPTDDEAQQSSVYSKACAKAIMEIVNQAGHKPVLIGLGMPGLKTDDKRGIAVVANGPRMINYSDELEHDLVQAGIPLAAPVSHLGSDADYCGIGENYANEGLFRTSENAYYLGGGTGVADAMKIDGKLLAFDHAKAWIAKTWEMKSAEELPLEQVTAVGGIQKTYAGIAGTSVEELNDKGVYPLQIAELANRGDDFALQTYDIVNSNLARLIYERLVTLNVGWQHLFEFVNPNKPQPENKHPYLGNLFDKIVIGQRLGDLFDSSSGSKVVKAPVLRQLNELIQHSKFLSPQVKDYYSNLSEIIKTSKLREAPALGAGIDAYFSKN